MSDECNFDVQNGHMLCTIPFKDAMSTFEYAYTGPNADNLGWKSIPMPSSILDQANAAPTGSLNPNVKGFGKVVRIDDRMAMGGKSSIKIVSTKGPDIFGGVNKSTTWVDLPNDTEVFPPTADLIKDPRILITCVEFQKSAAKTVDRLTGLYFYNVSDFMIASKLQAYNEGISAFNMTEYQRKDIQKDKRFIGKQSAGAGNIRMMGSFPDSVLCGIYFSASNSGNTVLNGICCAFRRFFDLTSPIEYMCYTTLQNEYTATSAPSNWTSGYVCPPGSFINQLCFAFTNEVDESDGLALGKLNLVSVDITGYDIG